MLDWNKFRTLPGDPRLNFEKLWRQLIGSRYGRYGVFREFKNMPGVEFVLELEKDCDSLGKKGDIIGWQCKFPDRLEVDGTISSKSKSLFVESLKKCSRELSRCFLCSNATNILADDEEWIREKTSEIGFPLEWQTEAHLEMLFTSVDNGAILKESYFGDLVLSREELAKALELSIAPVAHRHIPDVMEMTQAEEQLRHKLLEQSAWDRDVPNIPEYVWYNQGQDARYARIIAAMNWVGKKRQRAKENGDEYKGVLDWHLEVCRSVRQDAIACVGTFLVGVMADAGCGKTCLGISVCKEISGGRPAGAFFLARELVDGNLDSLAHTYKFRGRCASSMDEVLSMLNTVGQAYCCKMPLVIDGLNESRHCAEWKPILARLVAQVDRDYPHVLLIVTFRSGRVAGQRYIQNHEECPSKLRDTYIELCLPLLKDGGRYPVLELTRWDAQRMMGRYFRYYKIDAEETILPDALCHPLALSIYCQSENNGRQAVKHVAQLPRLLANVFDGYTSKVVENIVQHKSECNIIPEKTRKAIVAIGRTLLESGRRHIKETELLGIIGQDNIQYPLDWCRVFAEEGLLIGNIVAGEQLYECTYDALGGYLIAEYILTYKLNSSEWANHDLADDIAASLLELYASRNNGAYVRDLYPEVNRFLFAKHVVKLSNDAVGNWATAEVIFAAEKDTSALCNAVDKCIRHLYEKGHLYGADMLDMMLRNLSLAHRDQTWGRRIVQNQNKWDSLWGECEERDDYNLILCKWLLSSICKTVRDRATHILQDIGLRKPNELLDVIIDALSINDAYIVERMAAVGYGVAMCLNIERNEGWNLLIIDYAERIIETVLRRGAPCPTSHEWVLDALVNTVALAKYIDKDGHSRIIRDFVIPYKTWFCPFKRFRHIDQTVLEGVEKSFDHDFLFYRLPHLVGEFNYKTESREYKQTKAKLAQRIYDLGYRYADFEIDDRYLGGYLQRSDYVDAGYCYESFGKKYASIAYDEMEPWAKKINKGALIFAEDKLAQRWIRDYARKGRAYWTPYFWPRFEAFPKRLPEMVTGAKCGMPRWLTDGGVPNIDEILSGDIFGDGNKWVLLHGFIEQEREGKYRITHRTDGVLTTDDGIQRIKEKGAENTDYNPREYHATIYWEFPWSRQCTWNPNTGDEYGYAFTPNVQGDIEIPYCSVETGARNEASRENVSRFACLPDLHMIRSLNLRPSIHNLNWYDSNGEIATRFYSRPDRLNRNDPDNYSLLFIRRDLLAKYVRIRGLRFIQRCFGERYPGMALIDADLNYSKDSGINYREKEFAYIRRPINDFQGAYYAGDEYKSIIAQCPSIKVVIDAKGEGLIASDETDDGYGIWPSGAFADYSIMFSEPQGVEFWGASNKSIDKFIYARRLFLQDRRSVFVLNPKVHCSEIDRRKIALIVLKTILKCPKSSLWYLAWTTSKIGAKVNAWCIKWNNRNKKQLSPGHIKIEDLLFRVNKGGVLHIVPCRDETNGIYVLSKCLAAKDNVSVVEALECHNAIIDDDVKEVWVHGMWLPKEWLACWRVLRAKKKLVRMTHGSLSPVYLKQQSPIKKKLVSPIERYLLRKASKVIATCDAEREWIRNYEPKVKFIEVLDCKQLFHLPETRVNSGSIIHMPLHLLYLGRNHPLKGLKYLEMAVNGDSRINLRIVTNANDVDKEALWQWCDAFVLPTLSENFGLVIAEALERGKRVITTDGAPAWGEGCECKMKNEEFKIGKGEIWTGYGGRLVYLRGYRDGTPDDRVRLLKAAIEGVCN